MINKYSKFCTVVLTTYIGSVFCFVGCNSDSTQSKETVNVSINDTLSPKTSEPTKVKLNLSMSINDIPFPFEILDTLYGKKIPFDDKVMNPLENYSKYIQYNAKATNLGIYGADLAYAVTYEQFQQIGPYVKNTKKLAEDLNIDFAFNQEMMDKYNKYKNNKDSLTKIVFDSYQKVDNALKNDERVGIASLVVTGSWIEGLYLSTGTFINSPKTDDNKSIYKIIGKQKISLKLVINLLDEYKSDPYIATLMKKLEELTSDYNAVTRDNILSELQLLSIHKKVEKIRNFLIQ